jgi:nucleoside-diphosphate-sugar epimerase
MRALIVGASGAVGSAVARRACALGVDVHVALRADSDLRRLPVALRAGRHVLALHDARSVQHLVSQTRPDWVLMAAFPAHVRGTGGGVAVEQAMLANAQGLLEGLSAAGFDGAITWIGSALSTLHDAQGQPCTERGRVKLAESRFVGTFARKRGLSFTELRLYTGYGPYEQPDRLLPALLRAALLGARIPLAEHGTRRDWIHYQDLADACLATAHWRGGEPRRFDACSGRVHDARAVAGLLEEITGRSLVAPGAFDREPFCGDYEPGTPPAQASLDWRPRFDLRSGLEDYWRWAQSPCGRDWLQARETTAA